MMQKNHPKRESSPFSSRAETSLVPWWRSADLGMVNKTSPSSMSSVASIPYSATVPSLLTHTYGEKKFVLKWLAITVKDKNRLFPTNEAFFTSLCSIIKIELLRVTVP